MSVCINVILQLRKTLHPKGRNNISSEILKFRGISIFDLVATLFNSSSAPKAMAALRGLAKSPILRTQYHAVSLTPICIRRIHLAINAPSSLPSILAFPPSLRFAFPSITVLIPIITGIWDSILRAVPKKKTTHSRKRKRQLVGKGLDDKTNLTRCEACGEWKLLHTLCGSCVKSIQRDWRRREQQGQL